MLSLVVTYLFTKAIPGAVNRHEDKTLGMLRTEITCAACGGHLGHVFKGEGFDTPSKYYTSLVICSILTINIS